MTDAELEAHIKKELDKVDWPIKYGTVTVTIRDGKPTLARIEKTVKLD